MRKVLFVLAAVIGLTACSKIKSFDSISKGMTKDQVVELVGEPEEKMPMFVASWWKYNLDNKVIVMHNDTVVRVVMDLKSAMDSMDVIGAELKQIMERKDGK